METPTGAIVGHSRQRYRCCGDGPTDRQTGAASHPGTGQLRDGRYCPPHTRSLHNNAPTSEGQTFHGDHLYAFYQVPQNPKPLPIVLLHGAYQSERSWETTSDGREGFQNIFLHRHFAVYLVDQPRLGAPATALWPPPLSPRLMTSSFSTSSGSEPGPTTLTACSSIGKPETLNQFFRSITPSTGPYDAVIVSDAMSALFGRIGPAILFTHSQAGGPGWLTAIKIRTSRQSSRSSRAAASSSLRGSFRGDAKRGGPIDSRDGLA